jgi:hypothetical protein
VNKNATRLTAAPFLEPYKTISQQDSDKVYKAIYAVSNRLRIEAINHIQYPQMKKAHIFLQRFKNGWAIKDLICQYLKNSKYYQYDLVKRARAVSVWVYHIRTDTNGLRLEISSLV